MAFVAMACISLSSIPFFVGLSRNAGSAFSEHGG
jgi:hypothetical protein